MRKEWPDGIGKGEDVVAADVMVVFTFDATIWAGDEMQIFPTLGSRVSPTDDDGDSGGDVD